MPEKALTVLIPAYNEQEALAVFLPQVTEYCKQRSWQLIIVNDGSTDGTRAILDQAVESDWVHVYHHKLNRGYGAALKTGISHVRTDYVVTIDADGQHYLEDIDLLFNELRSQDADMIIGSREGQKSSSLYRDIGKRIIRLVASFLLDMTVHDINSGMKLYDARLAQKYLKLTPDSMAFSDIITLVFISRRHLVVEEPIRIRHRLAGVSTINTRTAFETVMEVLNIVVLFNPMRIFLPISIVSTLIGIVWGIPIVMRGDGVSVGAMLAIVNGVIFFFLALLAEQISLIRRGEGS